MKTKNRIIFLWALVAIFTIKGYGQTKDEQSVTLDPTARSLTLPPFDAKFRVNSFTTDFDSIDFKYSIDDVESLKRLKAKTKNSFDSINGVLTSLIQSIDKTSLDKIIKTDYDIELEKNTKKFIQAIEKSADNEASIKGIVTGVSKFKKGKIVGTKQVDNHSVLLVLQLYKLLNIENKNFDNHIGSLEKLRELSIELNSYDKRIKSLKKGGNYYFVGDEFKLEVANNKAHFPKSIGPLHPEVSYTFKLDGTKKVQLNPTELTTLKYETIKLLDKYFPLSGYADQDDIDKFKVAVFDLMKSYSKSERIFGPDGELKNVSGNPLRDSQLWDIIQKLYLPYDQINKQDNPEISSNSTNLINLFESSQTVFDKLYLLHSGKIKPSEGLTKTILDQPLNSGLDVNKDLTFGQFLGLLINPDQNHFINQVLSADSNTVYKVKGNSLVKGTGIDNETIYLLKSFFDKLLWRSFLEVKGSGKKTQEVKVFNSNGDIAKIKAIRDATDNLITAINSKGSQLKKIKSIKEDVPNILQNIYVKEEIAINKSIVINVFAENNAYIGLDLGLMYAFDIDGIFSFQGTHFYITPINREAPFKYFDDYNRYFLKRFSFYVGIAQLVSEKNDRYEGLFAKNSLALGVGYRLTRTIRFSAGTLIYNELDPNPLVDNKALKLAPTVALSIDIDLTNALGAIGKAINFK